MANGYDALIVGGGLVGGSLALGLADSGLRVALIESHAAKPVPRDDSWDARVYAISPGNAAFLDGLGVWSEMVPERISRIERMEVYGDRYGARLTFSAYEHGLRELGFIVENRLLQDAMRRRLDSTPDITLHCPARCARLSLDHDVAVVQLENGATLRAGLLVGADGVESWVRQETGIAMKPFSYGQLGVVANFATELAHDGVAYQWFRNDGVLALLPLPGQRASMVWSTYEAHARELLEASAETLAERVSTASGNALGKLRPITPPAAFPLALQRVSELVRPRLALVGDAAHNVHPLAGQGVNLGFRDVRELIAVLRGRGVQSDCGDYALLRRYERARREDVVTLQLATDGLQKLFANDNAWIARARNVGMNWVDALGPLKKMLVQRAVA
jgi:2-polyprenylphenol 6-hydroxylase